MCRRRHIGKQYSPNRDKKSVYFERKMSKAYAYIPIDQYVQNTQLKAAQAQPQKTTIFTECTRIRVISRLPLL